MSDSCLLPLRDLRRFSSGNRRGQPQARRETGFLCHVEETCCVPWATARFYDNNGKNRDFKRRTRLRWIRRYQVWDIHGTTRCDKDHEDCSARRLPEDKKGEHQRYSLPRLDAVSTVLLQQFCKEVVLWNTLSHPNVLRLVGVQGDMEKGQFVTVSEWMAHGNIMQFIQNNHTNRLDLVRDFTFSATSFTKLRR